MSKTRSSLWGACLLPLAALCVLTGIVAFAIVAAVPGQAAQKFGPPAARLSGWQRYSLSIMLLLQENDLLSPTDRLGSERRFQIEIGESVPSIIERLWRDQLITNPGVLRAYLQYSGLDTGIQAGDYTLSPAMTPIEIVHELQDATSSQVTFQVLAGWRVEEIAAALPTSGLNISTDEFLAAARLRPAGYPFAADLPEQASAEGFLFPGAYTFSRDTDLALLLTTLQNSFDAQMNYDLKDGFSRQGLSLYEAVTLASIIEREAIIDDEMPMIASVFINRHVIGMKLESDPTVQYALGHNTAAATWWTNPLSTSDLQFDSPYNTYLYPGLPPGPICNPGLSALQAVAFPAQTPYYYFRAACDGSGRHTFAQTYEQHLQNACP